MQSLFALHQSKISNYHHAHEYFREVFAPDLNSMEVQDHPKLQAQIAEAITIFDQCYLAEKAVLPEGDIAVKKAVLEALAQYHNKNHKDQRHYGKQMVELAEMLSQNYVLLLQFPMEACNFVDERNEARKVRFNASSELAYENKLSSNTLLKRLQNDSGLSKLKAKYGSEWDRDMIKNAWTEFAENDPLFAAYLLVPHPTFEEERAILLHIFKTCVFKNEHVMNYLEENNMLWSEDKSILKSLVTRTIRGMEEGNEALQLLEISSNWEEDKEFFVDLYERTVANQKQLEAEVEPRLKNWDHDRIATTDKIILNMALCEMIHFPSIPTKVTINEYIEICKEYSTPKSKQFVNGILDRLSTELSAEGLIRKSGRGLLDNKS